MEYEALMALIADGGGFDKVVRFVFDNSVCMTFTGDNKLSKDDFVQLGGTWFYKEKFVLRSNDTFDYDVPMTAYHPLEHLQSVVMTNEKDRLDIMSTSDMVSQST